MSAILAIASKDLRLLFRVRSSWFFTFGWPVLMATLFGSLYSGMGRGPRQLSIVVADEDQSAASRQLVEALKRGDELRITEEARAPALALVRTGKQLAAVVLPKGFGQASERAFHGTAPKVELWIDPSRKAEAAMLQGLLFQKTMASFQQRLSDPVAMRARIQGSLGELKSSTGLSNERRSAIEGLLREMDRYYQAAPPASSTNRESGTAGPQWQPLEIVQQEVAIQREGPRSGYDITFPQGLLWGIIGCTLTFGISFISERTQGTWMRLRAAPLSRVDLLAGKALACAGAITLVQVLLFAIGRLVFGVVPHSWPLMLLAAVSTTVAFVGLMMLVAGLGKNEHAVSGIGWALMMPLSLFGGGMMPLAFMPKWMMSVGVVSPVRWGIVAFEGALWRGFALGDMLLPCGVLVAIGLVCFTVGTRTLRTQ